MKPNDERARRKLLAIREEVRSRYPTLLGLNRPERPDRTAIVLGRDERGAPVVLPERPRLEHCHVVGTTGGGKSTFLEHMIRQDILDGRGVCVVDPHGEHPQSLYRSLLGWLEHSGLARTRTIHLIDPNARSHTVGFNPLARPDPDTDLSVLAGVTLEAFARAWGGEDTSTKPTIERVLTATFTALAELELTLVEAPLLLDRIDRYGLRAYAVATVRDRYARIELERLHELSLDERRARDFDLEVVGPLNRLARFVRPPSVRAMIGQTEHLLNFGQAFDEGHVLLCSLSGGQRIYERDADLLGRLLLRALFFHAKRRAHPERPFFVFIDECHRFLSGDLENILAELRKYGMGVVLSHQWLQQLAPENENMLAAVRNATNAKIIFRVKDPTEAEDLALTVVPLDLELPVQALTKPTVVGYRRVRLSSESTGTQSSVTKTTGQSVSETKALGSSVATMVGQTRSNTIGRGFARGVSSSEGVSAGESTGENWSHGKSSGLATGESQSHGSTIGHSHGESLAHGASSTNVSSRSSGVSSGSVMLPIDEELGFFEIPEEPTILTESEGESSAESDSFGTSASSMHALSSASSESESMMRGTSSSRSQTESSSAGGSRAASRSTSQARGESASWSESESEGVATSNATTRGQSVLDANSIARSESEGQTSGSSTTQGTSEALEPILEDRPSSVHSRENVLYMAAQALRSLPTGAAFVSYVGRRGLVASHLAVPRVAEYPLTNDGFEALRKELLARSPSALPADMAEALVEERERSFLTLGNPADDDDDPDSFRVPARPDAARRGSSSRVATRRDTSSDGVANDPKVETPPLVDGQQKRARTRPSQGSRSPEATAQSAALDRDAPRPTKVSRSTNGKSRAPRKV